MKLNETANTASKISLLGLLLSMCSVTIGFMTSPVNRLFFPSMRWLESHYLKISDSIRFWHAEPLGSKDLAGCWLLAGRTGVCRRNLPHGCDLYALHSPGLSVDTAYLIQKSFASHLSFSLLPCIYIYTPVSFSRPDIYLFIFSCWVIWTTSWLIVKEALFCVIALEALEV